MNKRFLLALGLALSLVALSACMATISEVQIQHKYEPPLLEAVIPEWGIETHALEYAGEDSNGIVQVPDGVSVLIQMDMPYIVNAGGNEVWEFLNRQFYGQGQEWLESYKEYWATPGLEPENDYIIHGVHGIMRCDNLLSIAYSVNTSCYHERMPLDSITVIQSAVYDMETGAPVSLDALFTVEAQTYVPILLDRIEHLMGEEHDRAYYEGYFDFNAFYLTQDELVLFFPEHDEGSTTVIGMIFTTIKLSALKDILADGVLS